MTIWPFKSDSVTSPPASVAKVKSGAVLPIKPASSPPSSPEPPSISAKIASSDMLHISLKKRNAVLKQFSNYLKSNSSIILNANRKDILSTKKNKNTIINRLQLNKKKIKNIIKSIDEIIKFKDPLGKILSSWEKT